MDPRWAQFAGAFAVLCLAAAGCSSPSPFERIVDGRAGVLDLTWPLNAQTPYWPGETAFPFERQTVSTIEKDGAATGVYRTPEHLGTHLDAPAHFAKGQATVDQIPANRLFGPAVVVDVRGRVAEDVDTVLTVEDLAIWESDHGRIPQGAIVCALTGWGERAADLDRYRNVGKDGIMHFPGFDPDAVRFLISERAVHGLGIDTLSVDPGRSQSYPAHLIGNTAGLYLLENLANLESVPEHGAWLVVAPIKIEGGSGGQARVFAVIP